MARSSIGGFLFRVVAAACLTFACSAADADSGETSGSSCTAGASITCACTDGTTSAQVCQADGTYAPCACGVSGSVPTPTTTNTGSIPPAPTSTALPTSTSVTPPPEPTSTVPQPTSTIPEPPPPEPTSTVPEPPPPDPTDPYAVARQACVDHINMYRATVGLAPLTLNLDIAACSDAGAELDSTAGAHTSAGDCPGTRGQNTCPGWDPGRFGGDVAATLLSCLDRMWAEGEPPVSREDCIADREGCFQDHGHYLNMTTTTNTFVSCGFFAMPDGDIWMNQDFGR